MSVYSYTRIALGNKADLTTPTSTRQYPLGGIIVVEDGTKVSRYVYVKANGALTQYQPICIVNSNTSGAEWTTASPVTQTENINIVGVPQVAFTSGYYGFVQTEGTVTAKIAAVTHTVGDYLKLTSGATSFTLVSATSGSTVLDGKSAALCGSVSTAAESGTVILLGRAVQTPAS